MVAPRVYDFIAIGAHSDESMYKSRYIAYAIMITGAAGNRTKAK
jgi:hypothetical protein